MSLTRGISINLVSLLVILGLTACGTSADFAGATLGSEDAEREPAPISPPPPPPPVVLPSPFASLTWFWQCASNIVDLPVATEENVVVEGVGPHSFIPDKLYGTPIQIKGNLCAPAEVNRDIVFIIDISGSMGGPTGADVMVGDTCGRLDAVKSLIASTPTTANFGVVLFSTSANGSSRLYGTQDELFQDLAPGGAIQTRLCQANGGTNYRLGLQAASNLFATSGRPDASKEIYFISDGQPDAGANGILEATKLRNEKTTIATVLIGSTNEVLQNSIASEGKNGAKLHAYIDNANQLAATLEELSVNEIETGILKYRSIGGADWTELNLLDHLNGYEFTLPSFNIDEASALEGIEVDYSYFDARGNEFSSGGTILWDLGSK